MAIGFLNPKKMQKIQSKNIVLPNGSAAGATTYRVALDSEYADCVGIAVIENSAGGLTRYSVGLKDDTKNIVDTASSLLLKAGTGYKADDRFMRSVPFKANGKTVTVLLETFEATTSDLNFDFLFLLRKKDEC